MKKPCILVAPGPYKECLDSFEVANAITNGIKEILPEATLIVRPLSDGGSGIAKILTEVTNGHLITCKVKDPLGNEISSYFGLLGDRETAIIESATATGLSLVPKDRRNPLITSTYGVGQLINEAISKFGVKNIIIGCGDSATNDCGIGCAAALGVKFFDTNSRLLDYPIGQDLAKIKSIDYEDAARQMKNINIDVACNLTSVLCGAEGTSVIYAPQKGASSDQVKFLHQGVKRYVDLIYEKDGIDLSFVPGAGGAGGLAASLYAFFGARLLYSIDVIDRYVKLDQYLSRANLVITGEGSIDDRTATGKICCGLALKAKKYDIPVIAITGSIAFDHEDVFYNGIDAIECIAEGPMSLEESMSNARELIFRASMRAIRFLYSTSFKIH